MKAMQSESRSVAGIRSFCLPVTIVLVIVTIGQIFFIMRYTDLGQPSFPNKLRLPEKKTPAPGVCYELLPQDEDFWTWEDFSYYKKPKPVKYDGIPMTIHLIWETKTGNTPPLQILRLPIMSTVLTMPKRFTGLPTNFCLFECRPIIVHSNTLPLDFFSSFHVSV